MRRIAQAALAALVVLCALAGARAERADALPALEYVALGDSNAAGTYAQFTGTKPYVPRYAERAAVDLAAGITVRNYGVNGQRSGELLWTLRNDTTIRARIAEADIVTWNIGLNDIVYARWCYLGTGGCVDGATSCGGADNQDCLREMLQSFRANWDGIIAELQALTAGNPLVVLRTMDIYNVTTAWDGPGPLTDVIEPYYALMNAHIHDASGAAGIPVARAFAAFNGEDGAANPFEPPREYIEPDLIHPNDAGSAAIAAALRALGYAPYAEDTDGDGAPDVSDNCVGLANPDQANADSNTIALRPLKPFDDSTRAHSDALGDACDDDDDNDGLLDEWEAGWPCAAGMVTTDPRRADSDGDNFLDGAECVLGSRPDDVNSRPAIEQCGSHADRDGDGLSDARENCFYATDPGDPNTDGDACPDGMEVASINRSATVEVMDLQQVVQEQGRYTFPGTPVEANFDITRNGSIDVIDLQQVAVQFAYC